MKLAVSFALFAALAAAQDFRWNKAPAAGQTVEIRGVNGTITVTEGSPFEVTAVKRGSKASTVSIEAFEHAGGLTICAVYPNRDGGVNECRPGGRMNVKDNDTKVEFTVRMPASLKLKASTVNGDVKTAGRLGDVRASSVNGSITVESASWAEASSVNGGITIALREAPAQGLKISTVNGAINLSMPSPVNADLSASTVNGSIRSDYPMTVNGTIGPRNVKAKLGSGGPSLNLSTVNGGIHLSRT